MSATSSPIATTTAVDDSGVRIGIVGEDGQVRDFGGIHIGSVSAPEGTVVDFAGVRLGRVVHDQR